MAKPRVSVTAPPVWRVGKRATIEVEITTTKALKVSFIDAELVGEQGWVVGSGKSRVSSSAKFPELTEQLLGASVLPAGTTTQLTTSFTLPAQMPPTHAIAPAYSRLHLRIHISIPWHFDKRYDYEFPVRVQVPGDVERSPYAIRSHAAANKPRLELSLASTRLLVGETLVGTCAVFHLDDREPRDVELSLVPMLQLNGRGGPRERRGHATTWTLTIPAGRAGSNVPFEIPLPAMGPPTFATGTHTLDWWLVARSGSFFGAKVDVSMPLEIIDSSNASAIRRLGAAPTLGDKRVEALFSEFAATHGWRTATAPPASDSPDPSQLAIEYAVGDAVIHLEYSYRGERGTFVVARIDHFSLGLGLSVTRSSSLRSVFFHDVEVDIADWDRAHFVDARSSTQAIPFLRGVVPTLMSADVLGPLVRWNDSELVFAAPVVGLDDAHLVAAAATLTDVAKAISAAASAIAPPAVATDLDGWSALATRLAGRLTIGDLSIDGTLEGLPVHVALTWNADARPIAVRVAVGDPEAASAELRAIAISLARPAHDVLATPAADALVEPVTRWADDLVELRVVDGVASASYILPALPAGEPPSLDVTRVRTLVESLRAVLLALQPDHGPYR